LGRTLFRQPRDDERERALRIAALELGAHGLMKTWTLLSPSAPPSHVTSVLPPHLGGLIGKGVGGGGSGSSSDPSTLALSAVAGSTITLCEAAIALCGPENVESALVGRRAAVAMCLGAWGGACGEAWSEVTGLAVTAGSVGCVGGDLTPLPGSVKGKWTVTGCGVPVDVAKGCEEAFLGALKTGRVRGGGEE
jgi:hypothetical protein